MTITPDQQKAIGEICRAYTRKLEKGGKPGPFLIELIRTFPHPSPVQKKIIQQSRRAFETATRLENPRPIHDKILQVVCGWGDTLEEPEVLSHLTAIATIERF